jgi:hypothetical protein
MVQDKKNRQFFLVKNKRLTSFELKNEFDFVDKTNK